MRLLNKVAVVTGGSRGIGKAITALFTEEGAKVVFGDVLLDEGRALASELSSRGREIVFCPLDVTKPEDVALMLKTALDNFGRIDICVNNAGVRGEKALTTDLPMDDWERVININLNGTYQVVRQVLPIMMAQGGGTIVNMASVGSFVSTPMGMPYFASKGGVMGITRSIAVDYSQYNIRANAVCPGYCNTDMINDLLKNASDPQALLNRYNSLHPIGRLGEPQEIAYAVLYLASDESSFTTGSALMVDGGYTAQ